MADTKISALPAATTPLAGTEVLPIVQSSTTVKVAVSNLTAGRTVNASSFVATGDVTAGGSVTISRNPATGKVTIADSTTEPYTQGMDFRNYEDGSTGAAYRFQNGDGSATAVSIGGSVDGLSTTGNLKLSTAAKGVSFTANTPASGMTSQLLNWYEEGTWTPVVTSSGGGAAAYTVQTGFYTRVGNQVTVSFYVSGTKDTLAAGNITIAGLPFAATSTTNYASVAPFNWYLPSGTAYVNGLALVSTSATSIRMARITAANVDATASEVLVGDISSSFVFQATITYRV